MSITDLPNEILSYIISDDDINHLALFSTCKYFYNKSQNRGFLESLFIFNRMKVFGRSMSQLDEREMLHIYSLKKNYLKNGGIPVYKHILKMFSENGYDEFNIHFIINVKHTNTIKHINTPKSILQGKLSILWYLEYFDIFDQLLFSNKDIEIENKIYRTTLERYIKANDIELLDRFMNHNFPNEIDKQLLLRSIVFYTESTKFFEPQNFSPEMFDKILFYLDICELSDYQKNGLTESCLKYKNYDLLFHIQDNYSVVFEFRARYRDLKQISYDCFIQIVNRTSSIEYDYMWMLRKTRNIKIAEWIFENYNVDLNMVFICNLEAIRINHPNYFEFLISNGLEFIPCKKKRNYYIRQKTLSNM